MYQSDQFVYLVYGTCPKNGVDELWLIDYEAMKVYMGIPSGFCQMFNMRTKKVSKSIEQIEKYLTIKDIRGVTYKDAFETLRSFYMRPKYSALMIMEMK